MDRHEVDRVVAAPKDGCLALLQEWRTDHARPELHEAGGADDGPGEPAPLQRLLRPVLHPHQLYWMIWPPHHRNHHQVLGAGRFRGADQVEIALVVDVAGADAAGAREAMDSRDHGGGTGRRRAQGSWIPDIALHHRHALCSEVCGVCRLYGAGE